MLFGKRNNIIYKSVKLRRRRRRNCIELRNILVFAFSLLAMGAVAYLVNFAFGLILFNNEIPMTSGLLYPRESETREVRSLDGIWNFVKSDEGNLTQGVREKWFEYDLNRFRETRPMPVPASYNEITEERRIRDHVGTVWYDRKFFIPIGWEKKQRVWMRFGSVHYEAIVWINGNQVMKHEIGHLPFEAEISQFVKYGGENRVTVLCDNVLLSTTIPQGTIVEQPSDLGVVILQDHTFDFFNYAGIHRSVVIYTTPNTYIEDVTVTTDLVDTTGSIYYEIKTNGTSSDEPLFVKVQILDKMDNIVATGESNTDLKGVLEIANVKPWWPYLMHKEPGYLYTMEVFLCTNNHPNIDVYRLKIGVRTLKWDNKQFYINGKPVYFRGFGRHEDADIKGKGLDLALLTKDFNLIKWIGANSYRTSHYPYSEESMQFADEQGIMIIDECPSVDTTGFHQALLDKHKSSIEQLIHRDKNHPSVVMWSIANEPRTSQLAADSYFEKVANYTKSLDRTRPVTAAIAVPSASDRAAKHLDIISFNRYNAWYANTGRLDMIVNNVVDEATTWNTKHNKPVLMSEYGAECITGMHMMPEFVFSEEFQTKVYSQHFKAFDILRNKGFFIGEFVWNFADFRTQQSTSRVGGNKKGVFTRNREPKSSAHLLRQRNFALCRDDSSECGLPNDLFLYISDKQIRDNSEL